MRKPASIASGANVERSRDRKTQRQFALVEHSAIITQNYTS